MVTAVNTDPLGGKQYAIKVLPVGDLFADHTYQRPQKESRAERLARKWDDAAAGVLLVSARTDREGYAVIDGQTRMSGARLTQRFGLPPVRGLQCLIFYGLSLAEEARLFNAINVERAPVHVVDRFRAQRVGGEPTAVDIDKALTAHGLRTGYTPSVQDISAVQALEYLYLWGSLNAALSVVTKAWPDDAFGRSRPALVATGAFDFYYRDQYEEERLIAVLREKTPRSLYREAAAEMTFSSYAGRSTWAGMSSLMAKDYNRGVKDDDRWPALKGLDRLTSFLQPDLPTSKVQLTKPSRHENRATKRARDSRRAARLAAAPAGA